MPFASQDHRAYMFIHHPAIAKRFESETPKGKKLPEHAAKHGRKPTLFDHPYFKGGK